MPVDLATILKALEELKEITKKRKFVQSVDFAVKVKNIDLKQPKNRINTEVFLPHSIGEDPKICVVGSGDLGIRAKNMGLDVLDKGALAKLKGDKKQAKKFVKNVDVFIAGVDLMPDLAKSLGPVLGPTGKMPLGPPKGRGIIPPNADLNPIVDAYKKMIRIRLRKNLVINCKIGTEEMDPQQVAENIQSVTNYLEDKFENGLQNIANLRIKMSMGPSVKIKAKVG